jgi:hypothetical protein
MSPRRNLTMNPAVWDALPRMEAERAALQRRVYELEDALAFYADPDTYSAIAFWFDPPCGAFRDDFSDVGDDWQLYQRPMPGALARETLGIELPQQRIRDHYEVGR